MRRRFGIAPNKDEPPDSLEAVADASSKLGLLKESDIFGGLDDDQMTQVEKMTLMSRCQRGR